MSRDDIIALAREADLWLTSDERIAAVERFAALVAAAEREACAQIADEVGDDDEDCHAWTAADAIRARSET